MAIRKKVPYYSFIVVGLNNIGCGFAREFMRYVSCLPLEKGNHVYLSLVDDKAVLESDTMFESHDIGRNRAEAYSEMLGDVFGLDVFAFSQYELNNLDYIRASMEYIYNSKKLNTYSDKIIPVIIICNHEVRTELLSYYHGLYDCLLIDATTPKEISFNTRIDGRELSSRKDSNEDAHSFKNIVCNSLSYQFDDNLASLVLLISSVQLASDNRSTFGTVSFDSDAYLMRQNKSLSYKKDSSKFLAYKKPYYCFLIIGTGGTGGNYVKEFCRYISKEKDIKNFKIALIDGDVVESKNMERQPFTRDNINQSKVSALAETVMSYGLSVNTHNFYIESHYQLSDIVNLMTKDLDRSKYSDVIPVIVGCVDNHRCRQVMHDYFYSCDDCIYLDAANEYSVGEVVFAAKRGGEEVSAPRGFYYPAVLTDTSPSKTEESCGVINLSSPQHLATNLMSAQVLLFASAQLLRGKLPKGIVYFDTFKYFIRHEVGFGKEVAV